MNNVAAFIDKLAEDLNNSEHCQSIKLNLIRSALADQGKALEDAIQLLRGEVTDDDRRCLKLLSSNYLIQVLCVNVTGRLPDLDAEVFKTPLSGKAAVMADQAKIDQLHPLEKALTPIGHDPKLYRLAEQFRQSFTPAERDFLITADKETISKTYNLALGMTVIQLLQYGLPESAASAYSQGLAKMHDYMMEESKSASKSLLSNPPLKESRYFMARDGKSLEQRQDTMRASMMELDQTHEQHVKGFELMVLRGYGVIVRVDGLFTRYLETLTPRTLMAAMRQSPSVIMGGPELEALIRQTPELKPLLVEIEPRPQNGLIGVLGTTPISILDEVPKGGEGKFLYVVPGPRKGIRIQD